MEPLDLFKGEPDESMEKINQTVHALEAYQNAYTHYKANLKNYFKNGEMVKEFDFSPKLVFAKWDLFMANSSRISSIGKSGNRRYDSNEKFD
jgi:dynein heavy chain